VTVESTWLIFPINIKSCSLNKIITLWCFSQHEFCKATDKKTMGWEICFPEATGELGEVLTHKNILDIVCDPPSNYWHWFWKQWCSPRSRANQRAGSGLHADSDQSAANTWQFVVSDGWHSRTVQTIRDKQTFLKSGLIVRTEQCNIKSNLFDSRVFLLPVITYDTIITLTICLQFYCVMEHPVVIFVDPTNL